MSLSTLYSFATSELLLVLAGRFLTPAPTALAARIGRKVRSGTLLQGALATFILMVLLAPTLLGCASPSDTSYAAQSPSPPPADYYGSKSLLLRIGMPESEIVELVGPPTKAEVSTCGQALGKPWTCKS